jgi:hypothetical protein
MIEGAHVIMYSRAADADREFLGKALGSPGIDAGDGWLIFSLRCLRRRSLSTRPKSNRGASST